MANLSPEVTWERITTSSGEMVIPYGEAIVGKVTGVVKPTPEGIRMALGLPKPIPVEIVRIGGTHTHEETEE